MPLSREDLLLLALASPLKDKTDLNQLISEQNYEGPDRGHFEQAVAQMNIEEPIEKLIDQLTS